MPSGNPVIGFKSGDSAAVRQIQTFLKAFHDGAIVVDGDFGNQTDTILRSWQSAQGLRNDGTWGPEDVSRANSQISASAGSVTWTKLGSASGTLRFTTNTSESGAAPATVLGVCSPSGGVTHYRGAIEVSSQSVGNRVVNDVATENYLRGVVPKEISASWATAGGGAGANAVRAQAVAARSYGLQQNRYDYATTCDSQSCQVYGGSATRATATGTPVLVEDYRTDQAIAATAGKIRTRPGSSTPVSTEFSASNGPRTAGGAFPPRDDVPGDSTSRNPNHRWTRVLDADELASRYGLGTLTGATMVEAQSTTNQQFDGIWFNDIVLTGTAGSERIPAWEFRGAHGLPSPGFEVRVVARDPIGTNVALIGDSVGESAKNEFVSLTDGLFGSLTIDTLVSRFITEDAPVAERCAGGGRDPRNLDLAVVELGYNPSSNMAADIDAMMNALNGRGTEQVIWINMADVRGTYAAANSVPNRRGSRWPNLAVADWDAVTAAAGIERARWITSDGVHLTTTGQAQFALLDAASRGRVRSGRRRDESGPRRTGHRGEPPLPTEPADRAGGDRTGCRRSRRRCPGDPGRRLGGCAEHHRRHAVPARFHHRLAVRCRPTRRVEPQLRRRRCRRQQRDRSRRSERQGLLLLEPGDRLPGRHHGLVPGFHRGGCHLRRRHATTRVIDTRNVIGGPRVKIPAGGTISIPLAGAAMQQTDGSPATIPNDTTAVAMNVTAVLPSQAGFFTVWPCDAPMPVASNVNFTRGSVVANGVVTSLGADGDVCRTPTRSPMCSSTSSAGSVAASSHRSPAPCRRASSTLVTPSVDRRGS